jgi:hypothetical protein
VEKEEERGKIKRKLKGKGHKHTRGEKKGESRVWRAKKVYPGRRKKHIFPRRGGCSFRTIYSI